MRIQFDSGSATVCLAVDSAAKESRRGSGSNNPRIPSFLQKRLCSPMPRIEVARYNAPKELRLRVEDEKRGKSKPEAQDSEGEVCGFGGAVMSQRIEINDAHDQERLNCVGQGEAIFPECLRQVGVKPGIQSGPQEQQQSESAHQDADPAPHLLELCSGSLVAILDEAE